MERSWSSRRQIILIALCLFLILDVARSWYGRVGFVEPVEPWKPIQYESLAWPPGSDVSEKASRGERIYIKHCAMCHGSKGKGDGPAAVSMIPRPRDLTSGQIKYRSTPQGTLPSDDDLTRIVRDGLPASSMPYWRGILSTSDISAVVIYIKQFSDHSDQQRSSKIQVPPRNAPDKASIERGAKIYSESGCAVCHDADLRGQIIVPGSDKQTALSRDLTAPWTFRGGSEPEDIWMRLTTGISPGPMPSFADSLTDEERWDVVNFILSRSRPAPWETGGKLAGPGQNENLLDRGRYLTRSEWCGICHTQVNSELVYSGEEYYLAGGMGIPMGAQGTIVSRNLTSDPETGLGKWTVEEVARALRDGNARGRILNPFDMPWITFHSFSTDDAMAIGTYLKSLPPVVNKVPGHLKLGFLETVYLKATGLMPIFGMTGSNLIYQDGNYGDTTPGLLLRNWPQTLLVILQILVVVLATVAYFLVRREESSSGSRAIKFVKRAVGIGSLILVALVLNFLYKTPEVAILYQGMTPAKLNQMFLADLPEVRQASFDSKESFALAERGRYLYIVSSCYQCHSATGAGGAKISARDSFGTIWVRNISSHQEFGIGSWTDDEIARAIRSGVSKDGEPLHWQGMPWDHLGNLDEEDVRSLVAYVRLLPPDDKVIPEPAPSSAKDCAEYTWFGDPKKNEPGCE